MGAMARVQHLLLHTRVVPTQLYRLMVLAWGISAVVQLVVGVPVSVAAAVEAIWFSWTFTILQLCGAVTVLTGLYLVDGNTIDNVEPSQARKMIDKLNRSLALELIGIIELEIVIAWQITASAYYAGTLPPAGSSWMTIIFGLWILTRVRDIIRTQRELTRR